jgi:DNA-binding MarR family transcriptional regulator
MADRLYRTQILLEPEQHEELVQIARVEGRSVSDVIREMLREQLVNRKASPEETRKRRLAALEQIRKHRAEIIADNGGQYLDFDVVAAIDQAREEQDGWLHAEPTEPGN